MKTRSDSGDSGGIFDAKSRTRKEGTVTTLFDRLRREAIQLSEQSD